VEIKNGWKFEFICPKLKVHDN
jgi:hypothetical protein